MNNRRRNLLFLLLISCFLFYGAHTHYWNHDVYINGDLTVTGTSNVTGGVTYSGTLSVTGDLEAGSSVTIGSTSGADYVTLDWDQAGHDFEVLMGNTVSHMTVYYDAADSAKANMRVDPNFISGYCDGATCSGFQVYRTTGGNGTADVDLLSLYDGNTLKEKLWYDHSDSRMEFNGNVHATQFRSTSMYVESQLFAGLINALNTGADTEYRLGSPGTEFNIQTRFTPNHRKLLSIGERNNGALIIHGDSVGNGGEVRWQDGTTQLGTANLDGATFQITSNTGDIEIDAAASKTILLGNISPTPNNTEVYGNLEVDTIWTLTAADLQIGPSSHGNDIIVQDRTGFDVVTIHPDEGKMTLHGNSAAGDVGELHLKDGATLYTTVNHDGNTLQITEAQGDIEIEAKDGSDIVLGNTVKGSGTSIGWVDQSAANQACNTTCTGACVFGQNTADMSIVDCADATADVCICTP